MNLVSIVQYKRCISTIDTNIKNRAYESTEVLSKQTKHVRTFNRTVRETDGVSNRIDRYLVHPGTYNFSKYLYTFEIDRNR